jgi:hypothetical protein
MVLVDEYGCDKEPSGRLRREWEDGEGGGEALVMESRRTIT